MSQKPIIGITMGDPASIGPEIAVKALLNKEIYEICRPLIVGDAGVITDITKKLGLKAEIHAIKNVEEAKFNLGDIEVFDLANVDLEQLQFGEVSAMAGNAAFQADKKVIDLALAGEIDATVTGPINKKSINDAGHHFAGHTEIYAHYTGTNKYAMLLVEDHLKVIHVSTHVSLRQACDLVKKDRILEVVHLLHNGLQQLGETNLKIGIAGLNPHAGD
ncbi:MAG TPA: 4-hydroxythreonine-4-phosphate dehydrogenase PdxA, partial [Flavisolibacter sp.]|nr:4-hydroxythreonine-4-phosphate dehydrogenase PdxA [Flavisolibacter sp.]